jgi:transposase-like protein
MVPAAISLEKRRDAAGHSIEPGVDRARSIAATAQIIGVGVSSLRRLIREGKGPAVTQLSPRRQAIFDSDRIAWAAARRG